LISGFWWGDVNPKPIKHCEATELTGRNAEKNTA
jgi:hypothetical protein